MENLKEIIFFAIAIKAIVEYVFTWVVDGKIQRKQITSFVLGEIIAFSFGLDAFKDMGFVANLPFVSTILTGLVISGGANLVHDIFNPENKVVLKEAEIEEVIDISEKG